MPAGLARDDLPENALRPSVALTERVKDVEVVVADAQTLHEFPTAEALKKIVTAKHLLGVVHPYAEQLQRLEGKPLALAHVDGSYLPRPVVHVLEEEPVYAAKLFQRPLRRWEILSQNGGAGGAEIVLRSRQRILVRGAHKVPQHVRSWNQVGIEDTRHRHSNP